MKTLVSAPAVWPLTRAEVRAHLRLDHSNVEPAPSAPLVDLAFAGAGNVNPGAHRYRITFVTADGETHGGAASAPIVIANGSLNGQVLVVLPVGGNDVVARRIYRTTSEGSAYFLVDTVENNTESSFIDNVADGALGTEIPAQNTTGDPQIGALIETATVAVQDFCGTLLLEQQWDITLDAFPAGGIIELPLAPLVSVQSITYRDTSNVPRTLSSNLYELERETLAPRVLRAYNASWPATLGTRNAVTIRATYGYGGLPAQVPAPVRQAMLLYIGDLYENRESVNIGNIVNELPAFRALLAAHRIVRVH